MRTTWTLGKNMQQPTILHVPRDGRPHHRRMRTVQIILPFFFRTSHGTAHNGSTTTPRTYGPVIVDTRTNTVLTGEGFKCFTSNQRGKGSLPILTGSLNGKQATFFLDTGSSLTIIDAKTAKDYGLTTAWSPSTCAIKGIGGTVKILGLIRCKLLWDN